MVALMSIFRIGIVFLVVTMSWAASARAEGTALQNCLCGCLVGKTNFSCSYNTTDPGHSPSCRSPENGSCICKAFGCFRKPMPQSGACHAKCHATFGAAVPAPEPPPVTATLIPAGQEQGTDRPGRDYRRFASESSNQCQSVCQAEGQCQAWTYVKPGIQGPQGQCWLKHSTPGKQRNDCCVSGVKQGIAGENDAAWLTVKDKCTDLREYNATRGRLKVSSQQLVAYVRQVERSNPGRTPQQIIAALHAPQYGSDLNRGLPIFNVPLFLQGPETDGWQDVDLVCTVRIGARKVPFTPKFVYTDGGEEVDMGHAYAGPRSDLNRRDSFQFAQDFMRSANTGLGDYWQVYFDGPSKFPMNQLRGDLMGVWLSDFYRLPQNRRVPFSEALSGLFDAERRSFFGTNSLMPPDMWQALKGR